MNLCDRAHQEVCYEAKTCPVCELREELNDIISNLQSQINNLEDKRNE